MADGKVGEAYVELVYDAAGLQNSLRAAEGPIVRQTEALSNRISRSFSGIGRGISSSIGGIGRSLGSVEGMVGSLAGAFAGIQLGRGLVEANTTFERLSGSLKTVTGSAEAGQKAFEDLTAFAAQTPFDLNQAVEGFITLKSRGLDPTMDTMRSFGNTAAALGKPMSQFVEAVADAMTGEMERLKEFGIDANKAGEEIAFTFGGVTTMVGNNAQEITAYLTALGNNNFASAMADQMSTLGGLFSNLGDSAQGFMRLVGTSGMNEGLKDLLRVFLDIQTTGMPLARTLGEMIGGSLTRLADAIRGGLEWFNALSPAMQEMTLKGAALAGVIVTVIAPLTAMVGALALLASPIALLVGGLALAGAAYLTFRDRINEALGAAVERVRSFVGAVQEGFSPLGAAVSGVVGLFNTIRDALTNAFTRIGELARGIGPALQGGLAEGIGFALGGLGGIIAGYAVDVGTGLTNLVRSLAERWNVDIGGTDWRTAFSAIVTGAMEGLEMLRAAALQKLQEIAFGAIQGFGAIFGVDAVGAIGTALATLRQHIDVTLGGFLPAITGHFTRLRETLTALGAGLFGGLMTAIFETLGTLPERIGSIAEGFRASFALGLGTLVSETVATMVNLGINLVTGIVKAVGDMLAAWTSSVSGADWPGVISAQMPRIVTSLAGFAPAFANAAIDAIAAFVQGIGTGFGVDVTAAIRAGVAKLGAALTTALNGIKDNFTGFWKQQAAEVSYITANPLTALKTLATEGSAAVANAAAEAAGLTAPIKEKTAEAGTAVEEMVDKVEGETNRLSGMMPPISAFTTGVSDAFRQTESEVTGNSYYVDMVDKIGEHTARLQDNMVGPVGMMSEAVATRFQRMGESSTAAVDKMVQDANKAGAALNPADTDEGKRFGWRTTPAGGGNQDATAKKNADEAKQRQERISRIKVEIEELKRLNAAQGVSAEEYARVSAQIKGETAARELGLDPKSDEGAAIANLVVQQDRLTSAIERQQQVRDAQAEVAGLQRIAAATAISNEEGERAAQAVAAEAAARKLGADATTEQKNAIMAATLAQEQATQAAEASRAINDLTTGIAGQERLLEATRAGNLEAERTTQILAAEAAVRQAGLTMQDAQGQKIYDLTLKQAALNAETERTATLQDAALQAGQAERLTAALAVSAEAHLREKEAIAAETAAMQLGLPIQDARVQRLAADTLALEANAKAQERITAMRDLEQEVADLERLSVAKGLGQQAYAATEIAIEAEGEARRLGIPLMSEEYERLHDLIAARHELANAPDPTVTNAFAGARAAMEQYVTDARSYGAIAGRALTATLGEATTGLADIIEASTGGFENMAETAEKVLEDFLKSLQRRIIEFMAQQLIMSFLSMFVGGGAPPVGQMGGQMVMGQGGMMGGRVAKGGVFSGDSISRFSNSIVRSPTRFARGGSLMGEAGPEAILPLRKDRSGRLGVMVANQDAANDSGAVPRVSVEHKTEIIDQRGAGAAPIEREERTGPDGQSVIRYMIRDEQRRNIARGDTDRAAEQRHGLRPVLRY